MNDLMNDVATLQREYDRLKFSESLSKKNICDLVIPFRDKYGLKDYEALAIARSELSLAEINDLLNKESEGKDAESI